MVCLLPQDPQLPRLRQLDVYSLMGKDVEHERFLALVSIKDFL